jgi:hypothetical protein
MSRGEGLGVYLHGLGREYEHRGGLGVYLRGGGVSIQGS